MDNHLIKTDLLVIGGGGAALRAALEAKENGIDVLIVQKGIGSTAYHVAETAGFNAPDGVVDPEDNPGEYYNDIMRAALGTCDPKLAKIISEEASEAVSYLQDNGVPFVQEGDNFLEVHGCFATRPRMHIILGHGVPIVSALTEKATNYGIPFMKNAMVTKIFVHDGQVAGASIFDAGKGEILFVHCKAIFMGTGGAGQLFRWNHNPPDVTGDGYALAFEAGAELINMEFMQAGLGLTKPIRNNVNTWLWSGYPHLLNEAGQPFLEKYLPEHVSAKQVMDEKDHYPFSSRDLSKYIEISIHKEIMAGHGTKNDSVYLDFTPLFEIDFDQADDSSVLKKMWPITRDFLQERGVDFQKDKIEVSTFGHAINGGIYIDENGQSSIKGLYSAGETAGGAHGADRLGGNMLLNSQVFGARAGRHAAAWCKSLHSPAALQNDWLSAEKKRKQSMFQKGTGRLTKVKQEIQKLMWNNYLVIKSEDSLGRCVSGLEQIKGSLAEVNVETALDLKQRIEIDFMIQTASLMISAASERKESRGSHCREDFPEMDESWEKAILINNDQGHIKLTEKKFTSR
jgi:fumarate reductase (CoM/CoB) subunit A